LKSKRNQGYGLESAQDLVQQTSSFGLKGQTNLKLVVNRANEDGGIVGRDGTCRDYGVWAMCEEAGTLTCYESLNSKKSIESMQSGGQVKGFGKGEVLSLEHFRKTQLSQVSATGVVFLTAEGDSDVVPNPKQRPSRSEKQAAKQILDERQAHATVAADQKQIDLESERTKEFANDVNECPRCRRKFLSDGWYSLHRESWCPSRDKVRETKRRNREVKLILAEKDEVSVEGRKTRIAMLKFATVILQAPTNKSAQVGIRMHEAHSGTYFVEAISDLAESSAQIALDFQVVSFGVAGEQLSLPSSETDLLREIAPGTAFVVNFRRCTPQIPYHGSARKGIHRKTRFTMHQDQLSWLEENVFHGGRDHMRPADAFKAMRAAFAGKIRTGTKSPVWLEKDQISDWLKAQKSTEKMRRKDAKNAGKHTKNKTVASKQAAAVRNDQGGLCKKSESHGESSEDESLEDSYSDSEWV
jgi:hypothetical protein